MSYRRHSPGKRSIFDSPTNSAHGPGNVQENEEVTETVPRPEDQSLPVEISFLVRQHAQSLARMNRLERELSELRNELDYSHHQGHRFSARAYDSRDPLHNQWHFSSARNPLMFNGNHILSNPSTFQIHQTNLYQKNAYQHNPHLRHSREQIAPTPLLAQSSRYRAPLPLYNNQVPNYMTSTPMATQSNMAKGTGSGRNLNLSDDSGGEYSRATTSDNDELSSLLDQILRISTATSSAPPRDQNSSSQSEVEASQQPLRQSRIQVNDDKSHVNPRHSDVLQQSIDSQLDEADNWLRMQQHRLSQQQSQQHR